MTEATAHPPAPLWARGRGVRPYDTQVYRIPYEKGHRT
jgi:hypothetical protein